jgi:hypothetical protein
MFRNGNYEVSSLAMSANESVADGSGCPKIDEHFVNGTQR